MAENSRLFPQVSQQFLRFDVRTAGHEGNGIYFLSHLIKYISMKTTPKLYTATLHFTSYVNFSYVDSFLEKIYTKSNFSSM
jgi:hypothetical protein